MAKRSQLLASSRFSQIRRVLWALAPSLLALGSLLGCNSSKPNIDSLPGPASDNQAKNIAFTDVAHEAGVDFTYLNGEETEQCTILESLGGGAAVFDFDLDGRLDLCIPGGGTVSADEVVYGLPAALFRNVGSTGELKYENVAAQAGVDRVDHYTHGAYVGDYDSDGFPDLVITGLGGVQLWRNQGDGTFSAVQNEAGVTDDSWSSAAAWGDLNGDGNLDLYLCHYVDWSWQTHRKCHSNDEEGNMIEDVCGPREFESLPDVVYYSNGDGTFRDATEQAGLRNDGKGLAVMTGDLDSDGDLDMYVANDTIVNFLYLNDGQGSFTEKGSFYGVGADETGTANGSMGIDICDYNGDGRFDIWVANYESEQFALYRNDGLVGYHHDSKNAGIAALGGLFVGFGTVACDVDRDGDEDFVISNGHVVKFPTAAPLRQLPLVMRNDEGFFKRLEFTGDGYFSTPQRGRGLACGDLDEDGDLDFVAIHMNDPVAILQNETTPVGDWLSVLLIGTQSHRDAIGARLILHTNSGDFHRQVHSGASYLSNNDRRIFWGLPPGDQINGLTIHWPSGRTQEVTELAPNQSVVLLEPDK